MRVYAREYLRKLRTSKHVTQKELADALGMSQNNYSQIECGIKQKNIELRLLIKLADFFNVDLHELISEEVKYTRIRQKEVS